MPVPVQADGLYLNGRCRQVEVFMSGAIARIVELDVVSARADVRMLGPRAVGLAERTS